MRLITAKVGSGRGYEAPRLEANRHQVHRNGRAARMCNRRGEPCDRPGSERPRAMMSWLDPDAARGELHGHKDEQSDSYDPAKPLVADARYQQRAEHDSRNRCQHERWQQPDLPLLPICRHREDIGDNQHRQDDTERIVGRHRQHEHHRDQRTECAGRAGLPEAEEQTGDREEDVHELTGDCSTFATRPEPRRARLSGATRRRGRAACAGS